MCKVIDAVDKFEKWKNSFVSDSKEFRVMISTHGRMKFISRGDAIDLVEVVKMLGQVSQDVEDVMSSLYEDT